MTQRTFVAGALAFLLASATVPAIYMRVETEDVPIDAVRWAPSP